MNHESAIAKASRIFTNAGTVASATDLMVLADRLMQEPEPAKEAPAPKPERSWVQNPVIGETIDVATKADFSDARTVVIETIVNANAFDVVEHNRVTRVNLTYHHTRRPVDARPAFDHAAWVKSLKPGDEIETSTGRGHWSRRQVRSVDDRFVRFTDGGYNEHKDCRPLPPVDRRTLPAWANCLPGDQVETPGSSTGIRVVDRIGARHGKRIVYLVDGGSFGSDFGGFRWPQSDAAPVTENQAALAECRSALAERDVEWQRMSDLVGEREATIAAKDAEIAKLTETVAKRERQVDGLRLTHAQEMGQAIADRDATERTIARLRAEVATRIDERDHAFDETKSLRAQLATAEAANKATVADCQAERLHRYHFMRAIGSVELTLGLKGGHDDATDAASAIISAINNIKSESRLVLHETTLERHPLPWHVDGRAIYSAKSTKVGVIDLANVPYALDGEVAELVVNAANRAVKL
jgi:hypothetical protein